MDPENFGDKVIELAKQYGYSEIILIFSDQDRDYVSSSFINSLEVDLKLFTIATKDLHDND